MSEVSRNIKQLMARWFIDLDWLRRNDRSFFVLTQDCLCPMCRERFKANEGEVSAAELLSTIRDCCSKSPDFITQKLPVLESVFRLFLANGNQPLDFEELQRQLSERWSAGTYRISAETLSRLLEHDQYYGLSQVQS